jgi:flagellar assembly factor FliW
MPLCPTKYFGPAEYNEQDVVCFPAGLPGFEAERRFLPLNLPGHEPLIFLQSLSSKDLCFVTLPVLAAEPDYQLDVAEQELEAIGLDPKRQPVIGTEALCLVILTIAETETTANLLAPLLINLKTREAVQAVAAGLQYSHRHTIRYAERALCS